MRSYLRNELQAQKGSVLPLDGQVYSRFEEEEQKPLHTRNYLEEELRCRVCRRVPAHSSWKSHRMLHQYDVHKRNNKLETYTKKEWYRDMIQEFIEEAMLQ